MVPKAREDYSIPSVAGRWQREPRQTIPRRLATRRRLVRAIATATVCAVALAVLQAEPVRVRYPEGIVHGFLTLRTLEGAAIGAGDLTQVARGTRVTTRLSFRLKDGSVHDETAVFVQGTRFRLVSDHLVQKGPSFPRPLDMAINARTGLVTVRYSEDGKQKEASEHLTLPPDLSNGLIPTLLKNLQPSALPESFAFVVATPKPQLVKLRLTRVGDDRVEIGSERRAATHYVLKVDIGGLKGLLAPLVGKQPPDSHVWILGGDVPAFLKSEQPLYADGPVWRIELAAPSWHEKPTAR